MEPFEFHPRPQQNTLYKWANALALITISYNAIEGVLLVTVAVCVIWAYEAFMLR